MSIIRRSRGEAGGPDPPPPPEKSQNIGLPSNIGPDPLKRQSYQASIQCLAIISTPARRHLNVVIFGSSLPSVTKTKEKNSVVKVGAPLTNLSRSAHACQFSVLFATVVILFRGVI